MIVRITQLSTRWWGKKRNKRLNLSFFSLFFFLSFRIVYNNFQSSLNTLMLRCRCPKHSSRRSVNSILGISCTTANENLPSRIFALLSSYEFIIPRVQSTLMVLDIYIYNSFTLAQLNENVKNIKKKNIFLLGAICNEI